MFSCVGEDSLSSFPQKPHFFKMEFKKSQKRRSTASQFYYPSHFIPVWSFSSFETKRTKKPHIYFRPFFSPLSSECLCSLFHELSSGNYLFCFFTLQTANGSQPGLNPTLLCPAVITGFERKPILWNAVRAHACRGSRPHLPSR